MDAAQRLMRLQQVLDPRPQFPVITAGLVQETRPLVGRLLNRGQEDRSRLIDIKSHGSLAGMNACEIVQGWGPGLAS
jgi:hypothetical protein